MPKLYLHGLASGKFDLAPRGLLGEDALLSGTTIYRLKEKWQAGLEEEKSCLLVMTAALSDVRKVLLAMDGATGNRPRAGQAFFVLFGIRVFAVWERWLETERFGEYIRRRKSFGAGTAG